MESKVVYQIVLTSSAKKDLSGLDATTQRRILQKLVDLATTPRGIDTLKLRNDERYRTRVGDYRILYTINDAAKTVTISSIRHRREVYR